ncbi:metal-dependent hydrolase family protein [Aspergillus foveolatus]|uniref:metal-dependent hydrolase family protein n=1 Tax=Aspergillus foveolatus TaxID=210207 RepID=UPI003CCD5D97
MPLTWSSPDYPLEPYNGPPRNIAYIDQLDLGKEVETKPYNIAGTHPESRVLITDIKILDATGREPYHGDVLITGERFTHVGTVPNKEDLLRDHRVQAHTHLSWNRGDLGRLGELGVEEHTLPTARSARCFLDSGYTMRLDVVVRDAISGEDIRGPRYLANGQEMARRDSDLVPGITAFADGPEEMREVIREHVKLGVDQVKLSMSGESITEIRDAMNCYFSDKETKACVDEAHKHGIRLCTLEIIYHGSYTDEGMTAAGMDALEKKRSQHVVVPAINWLYATLYEAGAFGYATEAAEKVGYKKEVEAAIRGLREMHRRGIVVLPGWCSYYGSAWTPHGTYARDLEHFTKLLGFTPHEAIIVATYGVAKLFMRSHEMGQIKAGNFADYQSRLNVIMINGRVHKAGMRELLVPNMAASQELTRRITQAVDELEI